MWKLSLAMLAGCTAGFSAGSSTGPSGPPPPPPGETVVVETGPSSGPSSGPSGPTGGATYNGRVQGQWTLEEREYWKNLHEEFDDVAKASRSQCNLTLGTNFAHESFRGRLTAGGNFGMDSFIRSLCLASARVVIEVCTAGGMQREAVANKVHEVVCVYGPTKFALANGVFTVSINNDSDQYNDYMSGMMGYLKKSL
jgi:hypothetical protein